MKTDDAKMVLALVFLALFMGVYTYLFVIAWKTGTPPTLSDRLLFVANSLAATIGAIVATAFGQELPQSPAGALAPGANPNTPVAALAETIKVKKTQTWRDNVPALYAIAYFVFGVVAIVTSLFKDKLPGPVDTLSYVTFGLIINIVRTGL